MGLTLDEFVARLAGAGLTTAADVRTVIEELPPDDKPASADELGRELVARGVLTDYQARAVAEEDGPRLVLGQYVIVDKIGQGGTGTVFRAVHRPMRREVALKVLHPELSESRGGLLRFQREMRAGGRLNHPHIVATLDADQDGDSVFLVLEYVPGIDLASLIKKQGPLPIERAVRYVAQAALGLAHAHDQGVIHRDVKPSNLMLVEAPNGETKGTEVSEDSDPDAGSVRVATTEIIKILDLGLARVISLDAHTELTGTGDVLGTGDFLAPEQAESTKTADARSDVYSLGCTLFYLLTGKGPYGGDTLVAKLLAHRESPVPSLDETRPEVPPELDAVFRRMVAKQPAERYPSMHELLEDLQRIAGRLPGKQPWGRLSSLPISPRKWLAGWKARPTRTKRVALAAAILLLVTAVLLVHWATTPSGRTLATPEANPVSTPAVPPPADAPFDAAAADAHQSAWTNYLGVPVAWENSLGMKFRLIPPGQFVMGATPDEIEMVVELMTENWRRHIAGEGPQRVVRVTQPFYLGTYEVTQSEYARVRGVNPSYYAPDGPGRDELAGADLSRLPVETVSWFDAIEFCNRLSEIEQLRPAYRRTGDQVERLTGDGYRLPTEAQWELACRAGTTTAWFFGDSDAPASDYGHFAQQPCAVGRLRANAFGLCDLYGNVWEWCQDYYETNAYDLIPGPLDDPLGPESSTLRSIRGGEYRLPPRYCRSGMRLYNLPVEQNAYVGFRVALPLLATNEQ